MRLDCGYELTRWTTEWTVEMDYGVVDMAESELMEDSAKPDAAKEEKMPLEEKAKKDAAGLTAETSEVKPVMDSVPEMGGGSVETTEPVVDDRLDRVLAMMDTMCKRMDAIEAKKADSGTEKHLPEEMLEKEKPKMDAAPNMEKSYMADEAVRKDIEELKKKLPAEMSESEEEKYADEQAKADSVYHVFNERAPRFMRGETLHAYMVRLTGKMKKHSAAWAGVDLGKLPLPALQIAQGQIYADAMKAARSPASTPPGTLRRITQRGAGGREIYEYMGDPAAWMDEFKVQRQTARLTPRHELMGA